MQIPDEPPTKAEFWAPPFEAPFGVDKLMKLLPHRFPFLLVDRIEEIRRGYVVGTKNVTMNEWFFQGHFPGKPVMPGVLQVEAMAQVATVLSKFSTESEGKLLVFAGITECKFRRIVVPGDVLRIEVVEIARKRNIGKVRGRVLVEGDTTCEAELTYGFVSAEGVGEA